MNSNVSAPVAKAIPVLEVTAERQHGPERVDGCNEAAG